MKKLKYIMATLMVALVVAVVLVGCKKEEKTYSCNPTINKWVAKNKDSFSSITREQIGSLPMSLQKSVFLCLTPEKQWALWKEKLSLERGKWDEPVQNIIDIITNTVDCSWYSKPLDKEQDLFFKNIEEKILTSLMDSIDYVICFCSLSTEEQIQKLSNPNDIDYSWISFPSEICPDDFSKEAPGGSGSSSFNDCKCAWDITCFWSNSPCIKSGCKPTEKGCGILGQYPCTGTCSKAL